MPDSYDQLRDVILYGRDKEITFSEVYSALMAKELQKGVVRNQDSHAESLNIKKFKGKKNFKKEDDGFKSGSTEQRETRSCHWCKKPGHLKKDCYAWKKKQAQEAAQGTSSSDYVQENEDPQVLNVMMKGESVSWILDSGCSFHMCPNIDWFESFDETTSGGSVVLGNNQVCSVKGVGSVRLQLADGSIKILSDVRLIPEVKRNLISLGLLERKGCSFESFEGKMTIKKDGELVLQGERRGNLYYLQATVILVGYEAGVKGYRLRCIETRKHRDVVFVENVMPLNKNNENLEVSEEIQKETQNDKIILESTSQGGAECNSDFDDGQIRDGTTQGGAGNEREGVHADDGDGRDGLRNYQLVRDRVRRKNVKPPAKFLDSEMLNFALCVAEQIYYTKPSSYAAAMQCEEKDQWLKAMIEEINSLIKNGTWILIDKVEGRKIISCKWLFKKKVESADGEQIGFKARLVARGFTQEYGVDFNEVLLYVDDILVAGACKKKIQGVKDDLKSVLDVKDLANARRILGMNIIRNREKRQIWLNQSDYISRVVQRFQMHNSKETGTPLPQHFRLFVLHRPSSESEKREVQSIPYANVVGGIMYALISTRPDVAQALSVTGRFMTNFGKEHWSALKWILRYLKGAGDYGILFNGGQGHEGVALLGYCDSDYAGNVDNRRSQTSYIFTMYGAAGSWKSNLQRVVALSTTEAEYMALTAAVKEIFWLKGIAADFGVLQESIAISCDSNSAISLAKHQVFHEGSKHIDVRLHFVREEIENGNVVVFKVDTTNNPADMLTIPLPKEKFVFV